MFNIVDFVFLGSRFGTSRKYRMLVLFMTFVKNCGDVSIETCVEGYVMCVVGRNSNFNVRCLQQHPREALGADASALSTFRKKFPAKLIEGNTYEICEFSRLKWKAIFTDTQIRTRLLPRLNWPSGRTYGGTDEEGEYEKMKDAIYLMELVMELVMELLMDKSICVSESQGFENRMRGKKSRKKRKVI